MPLERVTDSAGGILVPPGRYMLSCLGLEDITGAYGPRIKWRFHLKDEHGHVMLNGDARAELWAFSSPKLNKHPQNKTRPWAEALLARPLHDGEDGEDVARQLVGKTANALIGEQMTLKGGKVNVIHDMWPIGAIAPPEPEPEPEDLDAIPF
jgi:hypothetical protein